MRHKLLTTPPHCKANAVMLPTSPPPPMMLTFMRPFRIKSPTFAPYGTNLEFGSNDRAT